VHELLRLLGFEVVRGFFTARGKGHRRYIVHAKRTGESRFATNTCGHDVKVA
jgi:hypothetical protein